MSIPSDNMSKFLNLQIGTMTAVANEHVAKKHPSSSIPEISLMLFDWMIENGLCVHEIWCATVNMMSAMAGEKDKQRRGRKP